MNKYSRFKEWVENCKPSEILTTEEYMKLLGEVESIPPGVSTTNNAIQDERESAKPPGNQCSKF